MADLGGFFGGFDPKALENVPLFRELAKLLSWGGGPVNWELAQQLATGLVGPVRQGIGTDRDTAELTQAVNAAELWLDPVTALAARPGPVVALTPQEWVARAATRDGLGVYVEPVATGMRTSLGRGLLGALPEGQELGGMLGGVLEPLGAMLTGMQSGAIAGHLANELLGTYDLGVPTVEPSTVGSVGDALVRFADDYGLDQAEVRYWLALREALLRRIYAGVPWLRDELVRLVGAFASEADYDPGAMIEQLGASGLSPEQLSDPDAVRELLAGADQFEVQTTEAQRAVLARFQALIGFVAGYVEVVVASGGGRPPDRAAADRGGRAAAPGRAAARASASCSSSSAWTSSRRTPARAASSAARSSPRAGRRAWTASGRTWRGSPLPWSSPTPAAGWSAWPRWRSTTSCTTVERQAASR